MNIISPLLILTNLVMTKRLAKSALARPRLNCPQGLRPVSTGNPPARGDGPPAALPPVPTGTPLKTLAQRRPLPAAERDARLRTVAQRLERQGITGSLNNTVRSSDLKQMFFAVDEVFITVHKSN